MLHERNSADALRLWNAANEVASASVGYVEARSALAAARRARRISAPRAVLSQAELDARWAELLVVDLDHRLVDSAGELAEQHALRALDAVHLASALAFDDVNLVVATWDGELRRAAVASGLAVAPQDG